MSTPDSRKKDHIDEMISYLERQQHEIGECLGQGRCVCCIEERDEEKQAAKNEGGNDGTIKTC